MFDDNLELIFLPSQKKRMLWVLKTILMSTHNLGFYVVTLEPLEGCSNEYPQRFYGEL